MGTIELFYLIILRVHFMSGIGTGTGTDRLKKNDK